MNEVQIFSFEGNQVRTVEIEGEPWFVGRDVASVLGYSNPSKAVIIHVDDEDKQILSSQNGNLGNIPNRGLLIVNESGLYSLILSSKLPRAKEFKR
ncbi:anti-repressor [Lactobacillus phage Ld17]|uniref:Putative antirepressor n=1 Tax=Lactobacillus phage Ld17 TaxID=1500733 RepID=A0A075KL65_9CAUD|nr:anti-repressor [Lactobacillus phage Ld17]AIF54412.1 putative antirepressor [Lactobacillus phage Ld17]